MNTANLFRLRVVFVALLLSLSFAIADTSLYIPGYRGEVPISVTAVGVGPDGRTTWRLQLETPTGTPPPPELEGSSFIATMVQGPSDAVAYASYPSRVGISISCAIKSGQANCIGEFDKGDALKITTSFRESVRSFLVQGGGSPPTPTPAPSGGGSSPIIAIDTSSSTTNAAICVGLLVWSVAAGLVSSLLA